MAEFTTQDNNLSVKIPLTEGQTVLQRFLKASDAAPSMGIEFKNMVAEVSIVPGSKEKKRILKGVSGKIEAGEFLALMGPSGAGKSSLLNVLGSRFAGEFEGEILINGRAPNKRYKRYIAYVLQQDIILPNLTTRETLEITARLRLPKNFTKEQKMQRVDDIIQLMGIKSCEHTLVQFASGGERKRISIANELLVNPSILFLDEPTSGLDSTTAYGIVKTLKELCMHGRTIICAIHQPSSAIFSKFDKLLLMAKGNIAYFGKTDYAIPYLTECGYLCPVHYNPADFILELVTDNFESEDESLQNKEEITKHIIQCWKDYSAGKQIVPRVYQPKNKDNINKIQIDEINASTDNNNNNDNNNNINVEKDHENMAIVPLNTINLDNNDKDHLKPINNAIIDGKSNTSYSTIYNVTQPDTKRWPTTWFEQFYILVVRAFKHRKGNILSKLKIMEILLISIISGIIWFRMKHIEANIQDWMAATFFLQMYLGFSTMYRGVVHFPMEREVIKKERQSGSYRLSAYYVSKILAEFPVDILLPLVACIIFYWLVDLGDNGGTFILYILASCLGIFAANAFGTFLGCFMMDFEQAITALAVIGLFFMLISGFLVKDRAIPVFIEWAKYISFIRYTYLTSLLIILREVSFKCNKVASAFKTCQQGHDLITKGDIIQSYGMSEPLWFSVLMLIVQSSIWHLLAYWSLQKNTNSQQRKLCKIC